MLNEILAKCSEPRARNNKFWSSLSFSHSISSVSLSWRRRRALKIRDDVLRLSIYRVRVGVKSGARFLPGSDIFSAEAWHVTWNFCLQGLRVAITYACLSLSLLFLALDGRVDAFILADWRWKRAISMYQGPSFESIRAARSHCQSRSECKGANFAQWSHDYVIQREGRGANPMRWAPTFKALL